MSQDLLKTQAEQIAALRGQRDVEGSNYTLAQRLHWCAISWRDDAPALSALLDEARAALSAPEAPTPPAPQPLTERELELIDGMIEVQLQHAAQCDLMLARAGGNHTMAVRQKGWDMERVELLRNIRSMGAQR